MATIHYTRFNEAHARFDSMFSAGNRAVYRVNRIRWRACSNKKSDTDKQSNTVSKQLDLPEPPDPSTCCMSGCPNCVWIRYACELQAAVQQGTEVAKKVIEEEIKDETLKEFIKMQVKEKEEEMKNKKQ